MEEMAGWSLGTYLPSGKARTIGRCMILRKTLLFYLGLSCAVYKMRELKMHYKFLTFFSPLAPLNQLMKAMLQLYGKKSNIFPVSPGSQPSGPWSNKRSPGSVQSFN